MEFQHEFVQALLMGADVGLGFGSVEEEHGQFLLGIQSTRGFLSAAWWLLAKSGRDLLSASERVYIHIYLQIFMNIHAGMQVGRA